MKNEAIHAKENKKYIVLTLSFLHDDLKSFVYLTNNIESIFLRGVIYFIHFPSNKALHSFK